MKPLTLEETRLKEEMKERCLAKGQYIDEKAKAKFYMLCHLEDFEIQYWELQQENKQLQDNWNKLKKQLEEELTEGRSIENQWLMGCYDQIKEILNKMQELERSD